MNIQQKFQKALYETGVRKNDTVVLGVSGGIDSVVMLHLFLSSQLNLVVVHFNHGVRKEADCDEAFVKKLAEKHRLKFVVGKIQNLKAGNLEEEMRIQRRLFLEETAQNENAKLIALAHNANDQAETFFLNALRGSGPAGLAAMRPLNGKVFRPLLEVSREEIKQYAKEKNLKWSEDLSNKDTAYQRNYLRHQILPALDKINLSWLEALSRTSRLQRNIDDYLKTEANRYLKEKTTTLSLLPRPLLFEVFGLLYEKARGERTDLTLQNLSDLEKLIKSTEGTKKLELPGKITAVRQYDSLDFEAKNDYNLNLQPQPARLDLSDNLFGSWKITVQSGSGESNKDQVFFNKEWLRDLSVRTRVSGDKIETDYGQKKLQDLFVDAKIRRDLRDSWPVVCHKSKIIWVPGLAVSKDLTNKQIEGLRINAKEEDVQE